MQMLHENMFIHVQSKMRSEQTNETYQPMYEGIPGAVRSSLHWPMLWAKHQSIPKPLAQAKLERLGSHMARTLRGSWSTGEFNRCDQSLFFF